jgi:hypothetical protein
LRNILWATLLVALALLAPRTAPAQVDVAISISFPPAVMFSAPPMMVVIPGTYVYVVPDAQVDIFFYNGWWWRPWEGRWYRSRHYNSGWSHYQRVPTFYPWIPTTWRTDYRHRRWQGHQWNYRRIPHQQVQRNWNTWERNRHWEKQQTWGVRGMKPRPRTQAAHPQARQVQRQQQYQSHTQPVKPQTRAATNPQQARPQPRTVAPQRPKQEQHRPHAHKDTPEHGREEQQRNAPPQAKPQQGKPAHDRENKHDRNQHD